MPLNDAFPLAVSFITAVRRQDDGSERATPIGTAFIVNVRGRNTVHEYPSVRPYRRRPLLHLILRRKHGRVQPYLHLMIQPGFAHILEIGAHLHRSGRT